MTETVQGVAAGAPAPGWYPDPGGTGGQRWWSGAGWTEHVQLPAPPQPAPEQPAQPAPLPMAQPTSRFGGPVTSPAPGPQVPGPAAPAHPHAASGLAIPGAPALSRGLLIGLAGSFLLAVVLGFLIWSHTSGDAPAADTGGPRGPAAVAATKLDATALATAEETYYTDHQAYLPVATSPGSLSVVKLGATTVHLSPQDSAKVVVDPAGVGYCIVVTSRSPTTAAASSSVYVSTAGGLQPPLTAGCPASF